MIATLSPFLKQIEIMTNYSKIKDDAHIILYFSYTTLNFHIQNSKFKIAIKILLCTLYIYSIF